MIDKLSLEEISKQKEEMGYKNPDLSVADRVKDLLSLMTLEEKVAQMICIWGQKKTLIFDDKGALDLSMLKTNLANGIGQIGRLSDSNGGLTPVEMAKLANEIQKFFVENTRLGIPVIFHEECLHGLAAKDASSYPQPIGLASTFNPELIEEIYTAIAEDTRLRGVHQALTPVVDVAREPRWGRVEETFGEDPYLVSRMGVAAVKGFQGDGSFKDKANGKTNKKRVIATLKHFAAHGQPESGTNCGPVNVSERVLRDTFLYPFKKAIEEGNALSVMASYNEIDGIPSHANQWLLKKVLRKEWGFKGFVVSDYYAVTELNQRDEAISHSVAKDKSEAAIIAVNAGVNIELPDPDCYPSLVNLVREGKIKESVIDELVGSLLKHKFILGLFEDPFVDPDLVQNEVRLEKERGLALKAAHQTVTLLKNEDGLLPLSIPQENKQAKKTIAVIGPNANYKLLGGYSGKPKFYTTVLDGIKNKVGRNFNIVYSEGCKITESGAWDLDPITFPNPEENKKLIKEAVQTAQKADIVILAVGDNELTSREAWNKNHMGDRANLELFGMQNELLKAVVETGKPTVALIFNGRPISINYIKSNIPAILECWYLGQETGTAVADVLFGDYNPGGKLPISIPRSAGHLPIFYNYKPSARRGYLEDDVTALYPFGFGLSYTKFEFSNLRLEKSKIDKYDSTKVFIDVKNVGSVYGEEVVQLYIRDLISSVTRPVKELKGFKRIGLKAGESITISLAIEPEHLSFTNVNMEFAVEPGDFEIMVGNSSRDEDLKKVILQVE